MPRPRREGGEEGVSRDQFLRMWEEAQALGLFTDPPTSGSGSSPRADAGGPSGPDRITIQRRVLEGSQLRVENMRYMEEAGLVTEEQAGGSGADLSWARDLCLQVNKYYSCP